MSQDPCEPGLYLHFLTSTNPRAGWEDLVFPVAGLPEEGPGILWGKHAVLPCHLG